MKNPDKQQRRTEHYRYKSEKADARLEKARDKLPKKKTIKIERTFDEAKAKPKVRLRFEEEVKKSPSKLTYTGIIKDRLKPAQQIAAAVHGKIHEVERENSGVEGAHKTEKVAERGAHHLNRMRKNRKLKPFRKAKLMEKKADKANVKYLYQKTVQENPQLTSNPLSRWQQKRAIKKSYAAAKAGKGAATAKKTAATAKSAAKKAKEAAKQTIYFATRHWKGLLIIGCALILFILLFSGLSSCGTMLSGGFNAIIATSYTAEDKDICDADLLYTELEAELQERINNIESEYSGYDEYRYQIDEIGHDPHELIAYLTAKYEDFTFTEVESAIRQLFEEQYTLSITETVEVRYRTETRYSTYTDPDTGETYEESYEVEVPYDWYILNVQLTSKPLYGIVYPKMNTDQVELYDVLMESKGNRQYFGNPFSFLWQPYVTSMYGWRVHPISGELSLHRGLDIGIAGGTPILSIMDGTVIATGYDAGGFGNYAVIEDKDGYQSTYAHCQSLSVSQGQTVTKGQAIAKVGTTGSSTGNHLHLEIKDPTGEYLNPYFFIEGTSEYVKPSAPSGGGGAGIQYDIPPEALTDERFAAMIAEAEKYLGYPYVWGGSKPSTSFDCSGFVCWVINQSGVGSVGRTNASGLYNHCAPVTAANARPGDLIFFEKTYDSSGPVSHVGIYVGDGMMLHCGKPIQYASINTPYWRSHFYAFGRLP